MQPIKVKLGVFGAEGKRNVGLCHEMCLQWEVFQCGGFQNWVFVW